MLGGIDVAGAEQNGKRRHRQRHKQRQIAEHRTGEAGAGRDVGENRLQRGGHRFELQRDVGDAADDGDQRDDGRNRLALAVTGGDEIGDRGDVLLFRQPHDARDQRREQPDHQHRADIDGEEFIAGARGKPDRAEKRPRRAIDRQRQRIDQQARAAGAGKAAHPVTVARDQKQKADIAKRDRNDDPALQH